MADSVAGPGSNRNASVDGLAAVVLAAGAGLRLRPISATLPKPLCPVGGVPLLDLAIDRVAPLTSAIAVNLHDRAEQIAEHVRARPDGSAVHLSLEQPEALGTAGALGALRDWIDGRGVLVHNADAWTPADLGRFVEGWDGARIRVLITASFGPSVGLVATLLPWAEVAGLRPVPSGLYETTLAAAWRTGRIDGIVLDEPFVDCGTPVDYLEANLATADLAGGSVVHPRAEVRGTVRRSVVGAGAVVDGSVVDSVVWEGTVVAPGERLERVVRIGVADLDVQPDADPSGRERGIR
jgi:NDP-sugar pyrophosphorylase family protein